MDLTCFRLSFDDRVAVLTLSRGAEMNTMSPAFWRELDTVTDALQREPRARALVITSTGKHFCAGMSLEVFGTGIAFDESSAGGRGNIALQLGDMQQAFERLAALRMPVIASIQGGCIGGGVDMACACDIRYASADAFFCIQEINVGMAADLGTLQRLPRLIPEGIVRELAFSGRRLPAARALAIGLVNEVCVDADAALAEAMALAHEIATKPPAAVWASKQAIDYAREHTVHDGLKQMGWLQAGLWDTAAVVESIEARKAKRAPVYADLPPFRLFGEPR